MRRLIFIILILSFVGVTAQNSIQKEFWKEDKRKHSVGTFLISTAAYTYLSTHKKHKNLSEFEKRLISFSTAMFLGALKEVHDVYSSKGTPEWGDVEANLVGSLAFQVSLTVPLSFKKKAKPLLLMASRATNRRSLEVR